MRKYEVTAFIGGDPDVGIPDTYFTITLPMMEAPGKELRDAIRTKAADIATLVYGEQSSDAWFDDECGDCYAIMSESPDHGYECNNPKCINNAPWADDDPPYPAQ